MGKGLRIIMTLCPDPPAKRAAVAVDGPVVFCRHCSRLIETVPFEDEGVKGWEFVCPEHGQAGMILDGGELDLGARPRADVPRAPVVHRRARRLVVA